MNSRRKFIADVGKVSVAGMVATNSVSANEGHRKEFHNEVEEIFKQDGIDGLKEFANKENLEYNQSNRTLTASNDSEIGTENYYEIGQLTVFTLGTPDDENEFNFNAQMWLDDYNYSHNHASNVPDIFALSHDHDDFIPVGDPHFSSTPSQNGEFFETSWFTGSTQGDGLVGRVDFETGDEEYMPYPDNIQFRLGTPLIWEGDTIPRIWGSYQHSASVLSESVDSISLGTGGISVQYTGDVEIHNVADYVNP